MLIFPNSYFKSVDKITIDFSKAEYNAFEKVFDKIIIL